MFDESVVDIMLQDDRFCFCDNTLKKPWLTLDCHPACTCDKTCRDDISHKCGAFSQNSVYRTSTSFLYVGLLHSVDGDCRLSETRQSEGQCLQQNTYQACNILFGPIKSTNPSV